MKSETPGAVTLEAEVTNISRHGIWVLVDDRELFLAYKKFPWFKRAPLAAILDLERPGLERLRWPRIDVDLSLASISDPERYPLVARDAPMSEETINRDYVLWHLREAMNALQGLIEDMESSPDYGDPEFKIDLSHVYLHVNTAWNARFASPDRTAMCSQEDFDDWRQYPEDLEQV
jgi:hypothetical protein